MIPRGCENWFAIKVNPLVMELEVLHQRYGEHVNIIETDAGELIQIMSKQASKENAISTLCQMGGISLEKVVAFGDDFNDLGLFRLCGHSVAMGNAVLQLKEMATLVTDTNDNDGVAKILENYI